MVGKYPYSWGGGSITGATKGIKQGRYPFADDRGVVGFDCQGLAKYSVYQGAGVKIPGGARYQYSGSEGTKIPIDQAKAGDLVFFKNGGGIHHVGIIVDPATHTMVEAPGHNADGTGRLVKSSTYDRRDLMDNAVRYWD
jgi:cell wall-associated NlpC family hydrolase